MSARDEDFPDVIGERSGGRGCEGGDGRGENCIMHSHDRGA